MEMRTIKAGLSWLFGLSAWTLLDGFFAALAALLGVIAALLGIYWGWRSHRAKMSAYVLEAERARLEIEKLNMVEGAG